MHCGTDCHSVRSKLVIVNEASLLVLHVSSPEGTSLWGIQLSKKSMYWNAVTTSYDQFNNTHDMTVCEKY